MKDWPLILFTLATQLACGLTLAATAFDANASPAEADLMRPLAMAVFPLVAAGMLLSTAHLGRPLKSWRAVVNLGRSRLSREVILTAVFGLAALAYSGFWWMGRTDGRLALGAAACAAGIAAVMSAAAVYTIPTRPVWNSAWVPASFLGTAVLLGGLAPALLISWPGNTGWLRLFLGAGVAGSSLLLMAASWMAARSAASKKTFWLGCHIAFAGVLPVALAFRLWPAERVQIALFAWPLLTVVVFGAAIGRALMYWLGTRYAPF
jgi:anaerobic dimethyl sulfoxide reductase subunit C (anchor subunit)